MKVFRVCLDQDEKIGPYSFWPDGVRLAYPDSERSWISKQLHLEFLELLRTQQVPANGENQPSPDEDTDLMLRWQKASQVNASRRDYYFGFESHEHLLAWFVPQWWDVLFKMNMRVCEYTVSAKQVIRGKHQLLFKLNEAKLIAKIEMSACFC